MVAPNPLSQVQLPPKCSAHMNPKFTSAYLTNSLSTVCHPSIISLLRLFNLELHPWIMVKAFSFSNLPPRDRPHRSILFLISSPTAPQLARGDLRFHAVCSGNFLVSWPWPLSSQHDIPLLNMMSCYTVPLEERGNYL